MARPIPREPPVISAARSGMAETYRHVGATAAARGVPRIATPQIWTPTGKEAHEPLARMSVDELKSVMEYFRRGRDLNERHVERVRNLNFE
jgi:hypothetical protein